MKLTKSQWILIATALVSIVGLILDYYKKDNPTQQMSNSPGSIQTIGQVGNNTITNVSPKPKLLSQQITLNTPHDGAYQTTWTIVVGNPPEIDSNIVPKGPASTVTISGPLLQSTGDFNGTYSKIYQVIFITKEKSKESDFSFLIKN